MAERAMRPFWIHQLAEYLIGVALVAQGMQEPDPLVPSVAGVVVILNVAIVRAPLGAFKFIGRRTHRWLDLIVMTAILIGALQQSVAVGAGGRLVMLVMLVPLGFLWFYTDWAERKQRKERSVAQAGSTGDAVGRSAGRIAGNAFNAIKKKTQ